MQNGVSQPEKEPYDLTYEKFKRQMSKGKKDKSRNRLLTVKNKLIVSRGEVNRWIGELGDRDYRVPLSWWEKIK